MLNKLKKLIKNVLAVPMIRKAYELFNLMVLNFFALNRFTATIYSVFGFLTFNREQFAVLRARRDYYRALNRPKYTAVELRRNIHRLEKGMIMQPPKDVFAVDYILETVDFYGTATTAYEKGRVDKDEYIWAHDVLARYFSKVSTGKNDKVDRARHIFEQISPAPEGRRGAERAPYSKRNATISDVSYEQMSSLAAQRRSVRWFSKKRVPRKEIEKALLVARQAPTACNRLPYKFHVFDDPVLVKRVADIPFGASGYSHQIPTVVVVTGDLRNFFSPRDRHAIYIDASLAAMSFIFGLETLGLSSTIINWPDFEPLEIKMQRTLGMTPGERVVMLVAVGYADPDGGIPYSQKKSLESIVAYNEISK